MQFNNFKPIFKLVKKFIIEKDRKMDKERWKFKG